MAAPKSANMVRLERFRAAKKALQLEISRLDAQVQKISGQIDAVSVAIDREATVARATILQPNDAIRNLIPDAARAPATPPAAAPTGSFPGFRPGG